MELIVYQQEASTTCMPSSYCPEYLFSNLSGETGEVLSLYAKAIRKGISVDTDKLTLELGDVMWQVAMIAHYYFISLDDVATKNIEKLQSRQDRGVIEGSGDYR